MPIDKNNPKRKQRGKEKNEIIFPIPESFVEPS